MAAEGGDSAAVDFESDLHQIWRDDRWLSENVLNDFTALDYFSHSHWYDPSCLTAHFNMQNQLSGGKLDRQYLKRMAGIDFEMARSDVQGKGVYVIDKVRRVKDPNAKDGITQSRLASYYVTADGWVYMCPPIQKLVDSKLQMMSYFLKKALEHTSSHYSFSLTAGHALNKPSNQKSEEWKPITCFGASALKPQAVDKEQVEDAKMVEKMLKSISKLYPIIIPPEAAAPPADQNSQQAATATTPSAASSSIPATSTATPATGALPVSGVSTGMGAGGVQATSAGMQQGMAMNAMTSAATSMGGMNPAIGMQAGQKRPGMMMPTSMPMTKKSRN
uniref:Mediator of RNA polymerase II transcription subunit 6 n=1 Tax=Hanusia phi TaxID=3032 RepID=A0A7S0HB09_9CRYP|mmetsp:Transcript_18081/g.41026  ORF Transcript_18081/g.41026 Transcript_18081/m.41026 type:complete len:333 (+) Transcript_18081:1-999(+)